MIIERIIDRLPLSEIDVKHLQIPTNIRLADYTFYIPGKIDVILGASVFWGLLCIGQIKLGRSQPILQKTHLEWIVSGDIVLKDQPSFSICCFSSEAKLHDQIEKFWRIEEVDQKAIISKNEEICENYFIQTHRQDETGRFIVSLPF